VRYEPSYSWTWDGPGKSDGFRWSRESGKLAPANTKNRKPTTTTKTTGIISAVRKIGFPLASVTLLPFLTSPPLLEATSPLPPWPPHVYIRIFQTRPTAPDERPRVHSRLFAQVRQQLSLRQSAILRRTICRVLAHAFHFFH
jgi:hypothetical protein